MPSGRFFVPMEPEHRVSMARTLGTKLGFNADDPYFASIIGKTITQITFYAADGVYVLPVSVAL